MIYFSLFSARQYEHTLIKVKDKQIRIKERRREKHAVGRGTCVSVPRPLPLMISEHLAVHVRGCDLVEEVLDDTNGEHATFDFDVGDVDVVTVVDDVLEVLARDSSLEEEDDGLAGTELELRDLVAVVVFHVDLDASANAVHDAGRVDFGVVDCPRFTAEPDAVDTKEHDAAGGHCVVQLGDLVSCHYRTYLLNWRGCLQAMLGLCSLC